jgi:GNAT superfamily N-acetyltransferase
MRASTLALLNATWSRLAASLERARGWGADWFRLSTPFVEWLDGQVIAHAGIIELPMVVAGVPMRIAGIHAVCTRADQRGRGHMRTVLQRALAWSEQQGFAGAALWAVDPAVYAGFGFGARPESIFVGPVRGGPMRARPLSLERRADIDELRVAVETRAAITDQCGVVGASELALIDLALWWPGPQLAVLDDLQCVVAYAVRERFLDVYDVFCPHAVTLADIAARLGEQVDTAVVYVSPDRLAAPQLRAEPSVLLDTLMLRGFDVAQPLAVPRLSRC